MTTRETWPAGALMVSKAATLSHLDSSSVAKWCSRKVFVATKVLHKSRWRWAIERESFTRWVRARRA